jgi:hypothetical protein
MALYLLTCPHRTTEGLFRLPLGYIVEDLGWRIQRIRKTLTTLMSKAFVEYDESASVVLIVNALRDQPPENPNQTKGAISRLENLPETPLLGRLHELAREYRPLLAESLSEAFAKRLETLSNPLTPSPSLSLPPTPPQAPPRPQGRGRTRPRWSDDGPLPLSLFEGEVADGGGAGEDGRPEHVPARGPDSHFEGMESATASGHLGPHDVVDLYHELCPSLPRIRSLTPERKKRLTRLAHEHSAGELRDMFTRVEASDFLAGRSTAWRANLDWLLKPDNHLRVLEGIFDNRNIRRANVQAALDLAKHYEDRGQ